MGGEEVKLKSKNSKFCYYFKSNFQVLLKRDSLIKTNQCIIFSL